MSEGYMACYADVVTDDFVKEICPRKFNLFQEMKHKLELENVLSGEENSFREYLQSNEDPEPGTAAADAVGAYIALKTAFQKKTGLSLTLSWHDSDNDGQKYDEVDGEFWSVENVYDYTPAGKKYRNKIIRKTYAIYEFYE